MRAQDTQLKHNSLKPGSGAEVPSLSLPLHGAAQPPTRAPGPLLSGGVSAGGRRAGGLHRPSRDQGGSSSSPGLQSPIKGGEGDD